MLSNSSVSSAPSSCRTHQKKTVFKPSQLHEVDFWESDLANSTFDNCDLLNATFNRSILEKTDFRTAYNCAINPDNSKIKKA